MEGSLYLTAKLQLAEKVGSHICMLKLHCDIISDFSISFAQQLKQLAKKHNFLLMEDRKFADIGNTCMLQLGGGAFRIAVWADMVTAHALPGPSILKSLAGVAVVLIAEMSSEGKLTTIEYAQGRQAVIGVTCYHDYSNYKNGRTTS